MKCKHWAMVKVKKNRIGDRMRHELSDCYRPSTGVCVCVCVLLEHGRVLEMGECQDMLVWKLWV